MESEGLVRRNSCPGLLRKGSLPFVDVFTYSIRLLNPRRFCLLQCASMGTEETVKTDKPTP